MPRLKYGISALAAALVLSACGDSRTAGTYGGPCSLEAPCGGELQCVSAATFPDGYCSSRCSDAACGTGAICASAGGLDLCLAICASDSECRDGYQCWRGACRARCDVDPAICGVGVECDPAGHCAGGECTLDSECGAGRRCSAGACVDDGPPVDGGGVLPSGTPCAFDSECASSICLPSDRGGMCSTPCASPVDCLDFEAACAPVARGAGLETLCIPYLTTGLGSARPCSADAQCATGTCASGQCTEACASAAECLVGQTCTAVAWRGGTFTGCGYVPGTGTVEIPLGEFDLEAGAGTPTLDIATPPDSVSITLRAQTISGDPLPLSFYDVEDPRETTIFRLEDIYALRDPLDRWIPGDTEESIAMLVPNATSERLPYVPGRHRFRVLTLQRTDGDSGTARVRVTALVKRAPGGAISAGTLDLNIFLVNVGVNRLNAATDSKMRAMLDRFRSVMSDAGISVGTVSYFDITGPDATRYQAIDSTDGPDSELAGLFRLSAGRTGNAANIFLVRSIDSGGEGFNTLGIAGGIPGPSGIHGTMHSGVVMAYEPLSGFEAGHVMSHELGHFLGLWHVTERERPCAVGETPPGCAPWGGTDTINDTTHGDTSNLMNWSIVGGGTNDGLSTGQGFVLLRSAVVR